MSVTALPEKECDLVMKGGITSGVVYPGAITRIAKDFRFRNLGGASAGAIAAVAAAACEYRRNQGDPAAYDVLDEVQHEISGQGFVQSLFQPTAEAKPAFDLALRLVTTTGSLTQRLLQAGVLILKQDRRFLLGAGHRRRWHGSASPSSRSRRSSPAARAASRSPRRSCSASPRFRSPA